MDRGAWSAAVHGATKEPDMTEHTHTHTHTHTYTCTHTVISATEIIFIYFYKS